MRQKHGSSLCKICLFVFVEACLHKTNNRLWKLILCYCDLLSSCFANEAYQQCHKRHKQYIRPSDKA